MIASQISKSKVHLAVLAAFPLMVMTSFNVNAACTTVSSADTVTCDEGSTYINPLGTTVSNSTTISTAGSVSTVVKMVGNGSSFTNSGIISNTSTYTNVDTNAGQKYGALIAAPTATTDEPNTIVNHGNISAIISDANIITNKSRLRAATVVGVGTDAEAEYTLTNTGNISATHFGLGRVNGVEAGGDVEEMVIVNSGTITGTHGNAITKTTSTATSFQGTAALSNITDTGAASIGIASGIYAEEEVVGLTIENENTGTISGVGSYASGIYTRAVENTIINSGTISGTKIGVAQVSDSGEIRTMTLDNSGTINGDVMSVNGAALRWWSLSNGEGTSESTIDSRLNINSQYGQANSTITNSGTIYGDFYYSNGTHSLTNEDGGTIKGNIDLDQRNTYLPTGTLTGTKSFTFLNAGTFDGNFTIRSASSAIVTLIPTITMGGAGSNLDAPSTNISGMGNELTIDASAGVGTVVVAPKTLVTVKASEYFKVADTLILSGNASMPIVDKKNTPLLVNWNIAKNTDSNLVIGVSSLNSAFNVDGVTRLSAGAIDALMTATSTRTGGSVQSITSAEDLEQAGQQLRPEANNASYQSVVALANRTSSVIGLHQDQVRSGATGVSSGEAVDAAGFWLEAFGFIGNQKERGNVDGYQADTGGFVLGGDKTLGNGDARFGAAFAYGSTGISGEGATTANRTDIDSYQGILYGSYNADEWYADASLGYGRHQLDTKRVVSLVGTNLTGSHNANQYSAKLGFGLPITNGIATFTPLASLSYVQLDQNAYSESDSNDTGAALSVNSTKTESLRSGLGAKVSVALANTELSPSVEARALWNHEFADTNQNITARFDGGNSFTTNGVSQPRDSAILGIGLNLQGKTGQTLSVNYDAEVRNDYVSHTAALKARFDF